MRGENNGILKRGMEQYEESKDKKRKKKMERRRREMRTWCALRCASCNQNTKEKEGEEGSHPHHLFSPSPLSFSFSSPI